MGRCGRCGEDNPERARFCLACGTELATEASQARKTVTVLFADVVDSTGLGEQLDPEVLRQLMDHFFQRVADAVRAHGGTVEKFIGDAVMAVFGVPQAHEDDAMRALRAAVEIHKEVASMNEERTGDDPLHVRIGINSGEVLAETGGDGRTGVVGDPVNTAARLEKLAQPDGIVIGDATYQLVRSGISSEPLGRLGLKGKEEVIKAHVVLAVEPLSTQHRRFDAPMVGRDRELEAIVRAFERVSEDSVCGLFTVLGSAGIGKSRLIAELVDTALVVPQVLSGRCLPYGDGITFWPITEMISAAAHISDRDSHDEAMGKLTDLLADTEDAKLVANLVGQLIGLTEQTASQEETFWAIRKAFDALSHQGPLLLIFDDIHWAEASLLDLIDHVIDRSTDAPILLVCLARPELLESRPDWAGGKLNSTTILLEPLREAESKELFGGLLGNTTAIDVLLPRILEVSGGNPFFLEETVAMLDDDGAIEKVDGMWIANADLEQIPIPPTINALLTARLDRLPPSERVTVELAATMGKVFASQAVKDLAGDQGGVTAALEELSRKSLLRLDQEEFAGEEMYRFRHILIRDAAYLGIPKERRADIHERYADWLVETLGARASEYEEIVAYHLDQAFRFQAEVNPGTDPSTRQKAARYLASAGHRSFAKGDCPAAITLLERAALLSEPDDTDVLIKVELAEAMIELGEYETAKEVLSGAVTRARSLGDKGAAIFAQVHLDNLIAETALNPSMEDLQHSLLGAIEEMERIGYPLGLAVAHRLLSYAYDTMGQSSKGIQALEKALSYAREAGDERRVSGYKRVLIGSLSWSPMPVDEIEQKTLEFLTEARDNADLRSQARALCILGMTHALRGDVESGRRFIQEQKAIHDKLRMQVAKAWACFESLWVELAAEDHAAAESELRSAIEILDSRGERGVLPTVIALLADVVCTRGDLDEASSLVEWARELAGDDDVLTQIKWRSALARVRSRQGAIEEAIDLGRTAVEIATSTEFLDWQAMAWMDLAEVAALSNTALASEAARQAAHLFREKGMTVFEQRALARAGAV